MPADLLPIIRLDVVLALQEFAFGECRIPIFFQRLLEIYRAGHLPVAVEGMDLAKVNREAMIWFH